MKIQEALEAAMQIFPGEYIYVSIDHTLSSDGRERKARWIHCEALRNGCSCSDRSWEHVLAIARSGNEDCWPEVDDPIEEV